MTKTKVNPIDPKFHTCESHSIMCIINVCARASMPTRGENLRVVAEAISRFTVVLILLIFLSFALPCLPSGVLAKWMLCLQHVLVLSSGVRVCTKSACLVQYCYLGSSFWESVCVCVCVWCASLEDQLGFQRLCVCVFVCVCAFVCET